jgi:flagellar biosynthesis protein FlhG
MTGFPEPGMAVDQATQLRHLMHETGNRALTVAVTSGKGGVGKTNVSVNVAICLAAKGWRVMLLDADFGLANVDLLLNMDVRLNLSHVLSGERQIEEVITLGPGGIYLIPGASGVAHLANLSEFERHHLVTMLAPLERTNDVLIFDCGAGISENVLMLARAADVVMVVATPEPTSMADAYATIKALAQGGYEGRIGVTVNLAASRQEARNAVQRIQNVAFRFLDLAIQDFGYILWDEHVRHGVRLRCPVVLRYPRSPASACIMAIADQLAKNAPGQEGRAGFFRRVANLFF